MSASQAPSRRGNPVVTNYRGVTSPVQQYPPTRPSNVNQGSSQWRATAVPSPATGFRPSSPARLNPQYLARDRPKPRASHVRSHSAIVPPSSGNVVGNTQRYQVPMISVNGSQARPASFHTTTPPTMNPGMNGMHPQQKSPRQLGQQGIQMPGVATPQNFQQSHATFMALERDFQNLVKSTSSNHSRHGSFDSGGSNYSGYSRPSSATSQASSTPTDAKDLPSHGTRRSYTSSPLAKATRRSVDRADSPSNSTKPSEPPAPTHPPDRKHVRGESKSSRLRRVLSVGSLDDLSKSVNAKVNHTGKNSKWDTRDDDQGHGGLKPEMAGHDNGIYGSNFFSRSLDNIALSSTASSASAMFRKVGSGVKKGSRSLSGLFRPKSTVIAGSPSLLAPEASQPIVSIVTVEAETPQIKGALPPKASEAFPLLGLGSPGDGLNFEKIPKISDWPRSGSLNRPKDVVKIEVKDIGTTQTVNAAPRGILKGSVSPDLRPVRLFGKDPPVLPEMFSSPSPSVPSTPTNETQDPHAANPYLTTDFAGDLEGLMDALNRVHEVTESSDPVQSVQKSTKHRTTFSPRLVFYDTWTPEEYDRKGEIATCNLLTPKLAQQIKDEINTFKMEMEVHEMSKVYTQFH